MRRVVLYHGGCADGWAAAFLFKQSFPDAELVPATYGTPPPDGLDGAEVYVVDFSYKRPAMEWLANYASRLVVLDHHVTAQENLDGLGEHLRPNSRSLVRFDMTKSGAVLAWEYLYETGRLPAHLRLPYSQFDPPRLIQLVQDRDLWKWELPNSRELNAAVNSYPRTEDVWVKLHHRLHVSGGGTELVAEGRAILRAIDEEVDRHCKHAVELTIRGHKVLAVNATTYQSEVAGKLAVGKPFGACFYDRLETGHRVWSFRSREDGVDVSEIAKSFNGGGHRQSAGCERPLAEGFEMLA